MTTQHQHLIPTADTVRRLAASALPPRADSGGKGPEVAPVALSGRTAGGSLWWVGSRHVLRLATGRADSVKLQRSLRLRDLVRPVLKGVTVPVSVTQGEWASGLAYTLDTRISGGTGGEYAGHPVSAAGESDLAAVLAGLHEVPVRQAEAFGVPRVTPRSLERLRQAAAEAAVPLATADEFDPSGLRKLTPPVASQLAAQPGAAVLVHNDLGPDHLVVSAEGRVRGVLGWQDSVIGDPAEDIAGLARAVGSPAAVRAATLAGYTARPCLRGLWLARCDALLHLAAALPAPHDDVLRPLRLAVRNAWEPILLERVTDLADEG